MVRALLIRGMLAGFVAGLLVFGFGRLVGEPQVDRAIAFETAMHDAEAKADTAKGMPAMAPQPELVSRRLQASIGLFTGVVVYAAAFGGLFALVFALAYGRSASSALALSPPCWRLAALSPCMSCRTSNTRQARHRWVNRKA